MPGTKRRTYRTLIRGHSGSPTRLVENSLVLSIGEVVGNSPLYQHWLREIPLIWPKAAAFGLQQAIVAEVDLHDASQASLRLKYEIDGVPVDQRVRLITRTEQPGGWWFVCPLENIRVAKLYLPPGTRRFASRQAHGLIYKCQLRPKREHLSPTSVRLLRGLKAGVRHNQTPF